MNDMHFIDAIIMICYVCIEKVFTLNNSDKKKTKYNEMTIFKCENFANHLFGYYFIELQYLFIFILFIVNETSKFFDVHFNIDVS